MFRGDVNTISCMHMMSCEEPIVGWGVQSVNFPQDLDHDFSVTEYSPVPSSYSALFDDSFWISLVSFRVHKSTSATDTISYTACDQFLIYCLWFFFFFF